MRRALVLLAAVLVTGTPVAGAHTPPDARGGGAVLRAVSKTQTIATRVRYFGAANVDPATGAVRRDKVILSWFGVTNFAMAIRGHVVLLDAWVPRGGTSGYVPSSPDELARLAPEIIFIGHAHFDHAADATPIALATGATIVGNAEQCAELQSRAGAVMPPRCIAVIAAGANPGTRAEVDVLPGVGVTAMKHLHSGATEPGHDPTGFHVPVLPLPSTTQLEHPPTPEDMQHIVGHLPDAEAGTVLYRFRVGDLSLVWNDSAGPLIENAPGALDRLRELRPVDVHLGAIQGFNQFANGMRDMRTYVEAIGAPLFVPTHHDDWAVGITTKGENYRAPLDAELARIPAERRPTVRFISDPVDYVRPDALTFPVKLEEPRLTRRCIGRGRLRVALAGDTADVREVAVRVGSGPARRITAAPFSATFARSVIRVARRGRIRRVEAVLTGLDGQRTTLRRVLPSCGLR
jgi:L-ascorbate metabolism protein UlaG (beta-lactamase superfamily)